MSRSFSDYASRFKSFWGLAVGVALAGPLGLWALGFSPPWPDASFVSEGVATLFCACMIVLAYIAPLPKKRRRFGSIASIVSGLLFCLVYLVALSQFVVPVSFPKTIETEGETKTVIVETRIVTGLVLRPDVVGEGLSREDLLAEHEQKAEKVWTKSSLTFVRILLIVLYVGSFSLLNLGIGWAVQLSEDG